MEIKAKAVKGVKWTTFSSLVKTIVQFLEIIILARFFLSPADFGLMAIVQVVIGFSQAFMDMGISNAIIHKQDVNHEQLSSIYWLNLAAGILLFLILFFLSPVIADFYENQKLIMLIRIAAISFLLIPLGQQFEVLLQKELEFDVIGKIEVLAFIVRLLVTILFSWLDYGIYALIFGLLAMSIIKTSILLFKGLKIHKPSLIYQHEQAKSFIVFGLFQMGEKIINYFNAQFDTIIIGKLLGTEALGIYTIAKNLIMKPAMVINPIVTRVTFPLMAKVQNDLKVLKDIYLKVINITASLNFPIFVAISVLAKPIILTLFGIKWLEAVPILSLLALYALIRSTGNPVGSLILARGKANVGFYWNLAIFAFIPLTLYFGSFWGLKGIAISWIILQLILSVPSWYFLVNKLCEAGFYEYHATIIKPLIISVISGFIAYLLQNNFTDHIQKLSFGLFSGLITYLLLSYYFNKSFLLTFKSVLKK